MARTAGDNLEWFDELEKKITAVVGELAELRKKNRSLLAKAQRLEREAREVATDEAPGWEAEKRRVRARAEKLAGDLESLLGG